LVLVLALLWWLSGGQDVVTLRLPRSDYRLVDAAQLTPGQYVSLNYRHSVELTRVEGRFKLGPGPELVAWQTRMASNGTGLPNTYPGRTRKEGEWLVVDEGLKPVGPVRFFLASINQTKLSFGGRGVDLSGLKDGAVLQIQAERVSAWRWLLWNYAGLAWPDEGGSN
jgi:hypothetical protein